MIERDYILRMIQQLTAVLAKILVHQDLGQFADGHRTIEEAGERFLGVKWSFLRTLSDTQLIELLGYELHPDKMLAAAELLRAESDLFEREGKTGDSIVQGMKGYSLYAELIIREKDYSQYLSPETYEHLLSRLRDYELPEPLLRKMFACSLISGRLLQAGELMTEILDRNPSFIDEGIGFYRGLLTRPDDILLKAGFTREGIKKALSELETRKG